MATVTVTETGVRTQVNLYRNVNNTPVDGTKVTISGWSITDVPQIEGRKVFDEDVTALLSPEDLALFTQILDKAEQYLKNKWTIP
jgi:fructose-specific component phosphotransferase system IIB-like protein